MAFNWQQGLLGGGLLGSGLGSMLGSQNPASAAMPYEQQAMNQMPGYYQPYMQAGQGALGNLEGQYSNLLSNPSGVMNQIGASYHQSPGFQFALSQALRGANQGAAAGGMAGSPANQQQNMATATQLGNQDYYNYMNKALGMYGQGLQGEQGLAGMGLGASTGLGQNMADILNNQAMMQYAGTQQQNQNNASGIGGILGGLGSLAGMFASS